MRVEKDLVLIEELRSKADFKVEVKAVKLFASPDGGGLNANLYMDNKLVAKLHDGGFGGVMLGWSIKQ